MAAEILDEAWRSIAGRCEVALGWVVRGWAMQGRDWFVDFQNRARQGWVGCGRVWFGKARQGDL